MFFVFGLLAALWSASGYIGAFMRASNAIYDIEEGRPIWKTLPLRVGLTVLLMVLTAVSAIGVTLSGGLAEEAGNLIGVGDTAVAGLEHRQVAGAAAVRQLHVRGALLGGARTSSSRASAGSPPAGCSPCSAG